jgi:hypothetical protein
MANKSDVVKAKELLSKMDPELAMMAIKTMSVDLGEIDEIKKYLSKRKPEAVQRAIAEMNLQVISTEITTIRDKLKLIPFEAIKAAVIDLGLISKVGLCFESVKCAGRSIHVMTQCRQNMYVVIGHDELIDPGRYGFGVGNPSVGNVSRTKMPDET